MTAEDIEGRSVGRRDIDGVNEAKATTFDWVASQAKKWVAIGSVLICAASATSSYVTSKIQDHDNQTALTQIRAQQAEGAEWRKAMDRRVTEQSDRLDQIVYFQCATTRVSPLPFFCKEVIRKVSGQNLDAMGETP